MSVSSSRPGDKDAPANTDLYNGPASAHIDDDDLERLVKEHEHLFDPPPSTSVAAATLTQMSDDHRSFQNISLPES